MSRAEYGKGRRGGVYVEPPRSDVYTALLGVALAAIVAALVLLFLEFRSYDYQLSPEGTSAVAAPVFERGLGSVSECGPAQRPAADGFVSSTAKGGGRVSHSACLGISLSS